MKELEFFKEQCEDLLKWEVDKDLYQVSRKEYLQLGLIEEVGELVGKIKRIFRGEDIPRIDVLLEIADVLFNFVLLTDSIKGSETHSERGLFYLAREIGVGVRDVIAGYPEHREIFYRNLNLLCVGFGSNLHEVMEIGLLKWRDRANRGVTFGSGDNR